jgi:hypothetical protein
VNLRMINPVLALPFRPLLKFLTVGFLAPVFRDGMGLQWSDFKQRQFERLFLLVAFVITEHWCEAMLRRALSRRVSVDAMIEFAMWMAVPYIVIGLVFAFFGAEQVQLVETQLQTRLPAGSDIAAYVLTALLWPFQLLGVDVCAA